jgi:hypothetical protein
MSFREYLQTNIIDVLGLTSTYYDPWDGSLGSMDGKIGEEYRDYHDLATTDSVDASYYTSAVCSDEFNPGAFCGTGGMVSNAYDMYTWYKSLFIDYKSSILTKASIDALIAPVQWTSATDTYNSYFGQGVGTDVYFGDSFPFVIYYTGGMYCASTSIRMLTATDTDPAIIAIAFRNNVIVNASRTEFQEAQKSATGTFYDIAYYTYNWDTFGDSKQIVYDLAEYFRANPEASGESSGDDDSSNLTGAVMGVIISAVVIAAVLTVIAGVYIYNRQHIATGTDLKSSLMVDAKKGAPSTSSSP